MVEAEPIVEGKFDDVRGWPEDWIVADTTADEAENAGAEVILIGVRDRSVIEDELFELKTAAAIVGGAVELVFIEGRAGEFELDGNAFADLESGFLGAGPGWGAKSNASANSLLMVLA